MQLFLILPFLSVFKALYLFQSSSTPRTWRFGLENGLLLSPTEKVLYIYIYIYLCGLLIIMAGMLSILTVTKIYAILFFFPDSIIYFSNLFLYMHIWPVLLFSRVFGKLSTFLLKPVLWKKKEQKNLAVCGYSYSSNYLANCSHFSKCCVSKSMSAQITNVLLHKDLLLLQSWPFSICSKDQKKQKSIIIALFWQDAGEIHHFCVLKQFCCCSR
jgi:hypothetical protein